LIALISSAFIPRPFYRVLFAAQLFFYAASLLGLSRTKIGLLRRVGDAALTFVLLNSAAAVAFVNFVTGKRVAWTR
jgi:poly-beta-1,6-N-acetyl-D-glucosamine synthase